MAKNSCGGSATGTGVELHDGLRDVRNTFGPVTVEWCDRGIDEPDIELDRLECKFLRCLFWDVVQSLAYVTTTTSTSYSASGLNNNTTYYWKIVARIAAAILPQDRCGTSQRSLAPGTPVTVIQPNGGETFPVGSTQTIRWSAPAQATKFNLAYSTNNGSTWRSIASNVTGSSYDWQVPRL